MRLRPSDPDIETLVKRINSGHIDLQPDFQRGEVWSENKKKRLIDSVLREWHIPPIHIIIDKKTGKQEVLDGQQRLAAIRDFFNGTIKIDGNISPIDLDIKSLDGLSYHSLPSKNREAFNTFTVRIFYIEDYKPEEPAELFFRLNQPTNLSAAEQRNAFFGEARTQVKQLVEFSENLGLSRDNIGFSNSRMSYDDIFARICVGQELKEIKSPLSSHLLATRYRSSTPFDLQIIEDTRESIAIFLKIIMEPKIRIRFNKATLFSWLWFIVRNIKRGYTLDSTRIKEFIIFFENKRGENKTSGINYLENDELILREDVLFNIYTDRVTSRVLDVRSIIIRDVISWILYSRYIHENFSRESFDFIDNIITESDKIRQYNEEDLYILAQNLGLEVMP